MSTVPNPAIVTIGASAGGVSALREVAARLPRGFPAAVFVAIHVPRAYPSQLAAVLERAGPLPALFPVDGQPIEPATIYVAPPNHHLSLEPTQIRVVKGPAQNGYRPSIDVLFRSAARAFGSRVIGVVLTGYLDDGSAGLQAIKKRGGIAVVQDPDEAMYREMPASALRSVAVDHRVSLERLPALLVELVAMEKKLKPEKVGSSRTLDFEVAADRGEVKAIAAEMKTTDLVCPDCGGVLWEVDEHDVPHYRCRVGHGYSAASLVTRQSADLERALWAAIRVLEERKDLSLRLADVWSAGARHAPEIVRHFQAQASGAENSAAQLRKLLEPVLSAGESS